jgi:hypothetical protein
MSSPMSALGQKQTFAVQKAMSALPPIATAKADMPQMVMSALNLKADMCGANRQVCFGPKADMRHLFDHLIDAGEQRRWHGEAERLGCLEVDRQLVFCRCLYRQIRRRISDAAINVRFSNRPVWVKRFETFHRCGFDVAHGLVLLFGIGTRALPAWGSRTRRNNLSGGLAVDWRQVQADMAFCGANVR